MSTRIFLLRHGTTAANINNIFAGRTDEPLHDVGMKQLSEVAQELKTRSVDRIFCGPLPRTKMSAEMIKERTGKALETCEAFNEIDIPHWDGLTKDEIREKYGPEYPTWLETPDKFKVQNCETLFQVQKRAVTEIESILKQHPGKNIAVVTHLIVVRCLVLYYLDMPISTFRSIKINNASITELIMNKSGQVQVILGE